MDPEMLIYDEPFVGLDPISMGVIVRLIRQMNDALGITSIVVSHDVAGTRGDRRRELPAVGGKVVASGTPGTARQQPPRSCASSWRASRTGRCRSTTRRPTISTSCSKVGMAACRRPGRSGRPLRAAAPRRRHRLFLCRILAQCGPALRGRASSSTRSTTPARVADHHHALRGCSSAWCSACRATTCWQRFGSEDALGVAVALGLLKELGPVVAALLFAGRAGTALTSEIGLMKATDQLTAMQMMAVDPVRRWSSRRASSAASSRCRCWWRSSTSSACSARS
jgi:hypothetical protein